MMPCNTAHTRGQVSPCALAGRLLGSAHAAPVPSLSLFDIASLPRACSARGDPAMNLAAAAAAVAAARMSGERAREQSQTIRACAHGSPLTLAPALSSCPPIDQRLLYALERATLASLSPSGIFTPSDRPSCVLRARTRLCIRHTHFEKLYTIGERKRDENIEEELRTIRLLEVASVRAVTPHSYMLCINHAPMCG